jgi:hypothetical protein
LKDSLKMAKSKKKVVKNSKSMNSSSKKGVKASAHENSEMIAGQNVGSVDKVIRVSIAVLISALVMLGWLDGWVAIAGIVFAVINLVTAITGVCGIYSLLGISTCKVR